MGVKSISENYLLLTEGMHDTLFFTHLVAAKGLPPFQITSCGNIVGANGQRDGIDHLTGALNALPSIPGFATRPLEAILIAADNDSDPVASFAKVQRLINATADIRPGHRYVSPIAAQTKGGTDPIIVVLMMPWTLTPGALDTLCLSSASAERPVLAQHVDNFAKAANVDVAHGWQVTKEHKMRLRSLLSAAHPTDPYIAPAYVWSDGTDLVPLDNGAFDQVADFLRDFPTLLATP